MRAHLLTGLAAFAVATGAAESELDPYVAFPDYFPQHYRTLADVPEEYHDGEKLTGCFIQDTFEEGFIRHAVAADFVPTYRESVVCHNPFYLDEHGRIKNDLYAGDPSAPPPSGRPLGWEVSEMPPAPCEGCLTGEQVLSIFKEYHRNLGVQPLGYSVELVNGYPWDGIGPWNCKKHEFGYVASIYPDPLDPHPNERVNMRRVRSPVLGFNELCDSARDPEGRDLTWRVTFQIGWSLPEYRRYDEHNQHQRRWPRTPCTKSYSIHSESGEIIGTYNFSLKRRVPGRICEGPIIEDLHLLASEGRRAWEAFVQVHRRIAEHLPNAPGGHSRFLDIENAKRRIESSERRNQDERNRRWLERERKELRLPTRENAGEKLQRENRSGPESPFPPGASATPSGTQQIIVYWGDDPSIDYSDKCIDEEGSHLPRCASRVPKSRRCDVNNIPLEESDPREIDNKSVFECILWARLNGVEQCWHRNSENTLDASWCAKGYGITYGGEGMASEEIRRHIAAVETLTGHQVGMRLDDADFALQESRLEKLFPAFSFSDGDRFAEINVFPVEHWEKKMGKRILGFYQHRFGNGKYDDPFDNKKENQQYRRISVPYDWLRRGAWCSGEELTCLPPDPDRRYRYVLVHEGAHDVFASHLDDKFLWWNVPRLQKYAWQTLGVHEGFALYIEEIAGRRRSVFDLDLDRSLSSGFGDYVMPTPSVGQRKKGLELATRATKLPTAQAMLVALRGVEDALEHEIDSAIYEIESVRRGTTREWIVNHSLHWFNHLHDWFGRPNLHVDFCEFRNEVHRRVWLLKKAVSGLASPTAQPHVNAAFDDMDIPTCGGPRIAHKDCNEESDDTKPCTEVICEFSPGDLLPILIPLPDGVSIYQCTLSTPDAEVSYDGSGNIQVCVRTTVVINDSITIVIESCRTI